MINYIIFIIFIIFFIGLSNKENNMTIQLALISVKKNISYDNSLCIHSWYYENLKNGKGF